MTEQPPRRPETIEWLAMAVCPMPTTDELSAPNSRRGESMSTDELFFDPFLPEFHENPYPCARTKRSVPEPDRVAGSAMHAGGLTWREHYTLTMEGACDEGRVHQGDVEGEGSHRL
jgi:hypothetical protein